MRIHVQRSKKPLPIILYSNHIGSHVSVIRSAVTLLGSHGIILYGRYSEYYVDDETIEEWISEIKNYAKSC